MFCTKCGKLTFGESTLCNDCLAKKSAEVSESPASAPRAEVKTAPAEPKPEQTPTQANPYARTENTVPYGNNPNPYAGAPYGGNTYSEPFYSSENLAPLGNTDKKLGFGKALTATILGYIAYIFGSAWFGVGCIFPAVGIIGTFVSSVPMLIVALILGIKSIKLFKSTVGQKPVITLVFGIIGVVFAALTVLMVFITLLTPAIGEGFVDAYLGEGFYDDLFDI